MALSDPQRRAGSAPAARARPTIIGAESLDAAARVTPFRIGALAERGAAAGTPGAGAGPAAGSGAGPRAGRDAFGAGQDVGGAAGEGWLRRRAPAPSPATRAEAERAEARARAERAAAAEAAQRAALEAAFRAGYEQGHREGSGAFDAWRTEQADSLARRFDSIAERYALQRGEAERAMAEQVIDLAVVLARQTVRAALAARPEAIVGVVQEALAALVDEQAAPTVAVHPDDFEPVQAQLSVVIEKRGGRLVADAALSPGDCLVRAATGAVDASVAKRWSRALATIGRADAWIE